MEFTIDNSIEYIKNHHPAMFFYIERMYINMEKRLMKFTLGQHILKTKGVPKFDKEKLLICLLNSSDFFILSFVKYFNIDIYFFELYTEKHFFYDLLNDKIHTAIYLLSKNDEYKNINWKYYDNKTGTYFSYLIKNLNCIDMIQELINKDPSLLVFEKNIYANNCIEVLFLQFKNFFEKYELYDTNLKDKKYEDIYERDYYFKYDEYNEYHNESVLKVDITLFFTNCYDLIESTLYTVQERDKNYDNLTKLLIFFHKKIVENNIPIKYGIYFILINNKYIEKKGILYYSNKCFGFIEYLIDEGYISLDFIYYKKEDIEEPNRMNKIIHDMGTCYDMEGYDLLSFIIKKSTSFEVNDIIKLFKKYPELKKNKSKYLELSKEGYLTELTEYIESL